MGPEEIHIYFWEGAPRPPKRKCDRPKNLEVFKVSFQIHYIFGMLIDRVTYRGTSPLKKIMFLKLSWVFPGQMANNL